MITPSKRVSSVSESITLKLNSMAVSLAESGRTVYNLTAGQLPFMPEEKITDLVKEKMGTLSSFQYSPAAGLVKLREKFIKRVEETRGINLSKDSFDCVICNGAKHALTNVLLSMVDPLDEVIILAPYWISYVEMVNLAQGSPVIVSTTIKDELKIDLLELEKKINSKTKAIIINSPNNPSGTVYSNDWMMGFAKLLKKYPHVNVISDEIYCELTYNHPFPKFFYNFDESLLDRTIIIDGVSKTYALSGLRIGYAIGDKKFISKVSNLQGQTTSGPNSLIQAALVDYDFSRSTEFLKPICNHLKENALAIKEVFLKHDLSSLYYPVSAAFYFMIDFSKTKIFQEMGGSTSTDISGKICELLLDKTGVVMVPGTDFGLINSARISLVMEKKKFLEALEIIARFLNGKT